MKRERIKDTWRKVSSEVLRIHFSRVVRKKANRDGVLCVSKTVLNIFRV